MLSKIKTYFQKRTEKLLATHRYEKLVTNPLPILLMVCFFYVIFALSIPHIHFFSKHLQNFVEILDLPRILKLNFLENKDFYRFPVLICWVYLVLSVTFDLSRFWNQHIGVVFYFTDDSLFIKRNGGLEKFPFPSERWVYRSGWYREFLGLCRLELRYGDETLRTPYFFGKKHESLISRLKKT